MVKGFSVRAESEAFLHLEALKIRKKGASRVIYEVGVELRVEFWMDAKGSKMFQVGSVTCVTC